MSNVDQLERTREPRRGWRCRSRPVVLLAADGGACGAKALEEGEVVGTATVELDTTIEQKGVLEPDRANFRMLAVDPAWRARGIGSRLVAACIERARVAGKTVATLHTAEEMEAAARIYRSFGFERDEPADVVVGPGVRLRAYRLTL